jgi:hypothetical protein
VHLTCCRFGQEVYVRRAARARDACLNPASLFGHVEERDGLTFIVYQRAAAYRQDV